jgi:hypothetical protein
MTQEQLKYQQDAIRSDQARYDAALAKIGERARSPVLGESRDTYRREVLRDIKRRHLTNHDLYRVNMRGLPNTAIDNIEELVIKAAVDEYWNPRNVPLGEIHERKRYDDYGRLTSIDFLGQESFVKFMGRPGRIVTGWSTPNGPVLASGNTRWG